MPPERVEREADTRSHEKSRHSMGGSQRLRSNKHRPNILPGNMSVFSRSMSSSGPANHDSAVASGSSSAVTSPRGDKEKRVRSAVSPGVTERYKDIETRFDFVTNLHSSKVPLHYALSSEQRIRAGAARR